MYVIANNEKVTDNLPVNVRIAEKQEEYETLPAHKTSTGIMAVAFDLTDEDIEKIKKHKKIYYLQVVGNTKQISVKVTKKQVEKMKNQDEDLILSLALKAIFQPINLALTPEDIEEAVGYETEILTPNTGDKNA